MRRTIAAAAIALTCVDPPPEEGWLQIADDLPGALFSVWGTSSSDVWVVGADDGTGPTVLRFDGETWSRKTPGDAQGDLWWVFGFENGPVYLGGEGGTIVRFDEGVFETMATPGSGTVYGIWGASPDDVWAVGGASASAGGFVWRLSGDEWIPESTVPAGVLDTAAIWKVHGASSDDAFLVGSNGVAFHWDGTTLAPADTGVGSSLFTVHAIGDRHAAVGGGASGFIVEGEGDEWHDATPDPLPQGLIGVVLDAGGGGAAVGAFASVYTRVDGTWVAEEHGLSNPHSLHGVWLDERGDIWAVGGQVYLPPYSDGFMIHRGRPVPSEGLQ